MTAPDGPRVPFIAPQFPPPQALAEDYRAICASNRFTNFGPFEQRFRDELATFVGPDAHAVTFASATAALQAAALALFPEAGSGRRVLLPSFTFAAAGQVLTTMGLRPLFADIELDGLHADPDAAEALIRRHRGELAGILFANSFGVGAHHIDRWDALARSYELPLLIDSAAGFGSRYENGERIGRHGSCEVFSFHATKPLAVGEGGAALTTDPELAQRLRQISNFGFDKTGLAVLPGTNGKLSELPAAIGLRQLPHLDTVIAQRHEVLRAYGAALPHVHLARNVERSSLAFVTVVLPPATDRDRIRDELGQRGIEARSYYAPALHRSPVFDVAEPADLARTEQIEDRVLSLPCHARVTNDVVAEIAEVISA